MKIYRVEKITIKERKQKFPIFFNMAPRPRSKNPLKKIFLKNPAEIRQFPRDFPKKFFQRVFYPAPAPY
jgi:hypothetical protein